MSIKNTRVRLKDIKAGATIYVSHPVYGIDTVKVLSKPFNLNYHNSQFFRVKVIQSTHSVVLNSSTLSLRDCGITNGASYNGRRAFKKLKQAQQWAKIHGTDAAFIKQHALHEKDNVFKLK